MPRLQVWSMLLPVLLLLVASICTDVYFRRSAREAVSGLTCVQCMSMNTPSCLHGRMTATACRGPEIESKYCYKSVGSQVSGNGHFVSRGCSKSLQNNCTSKWVSGDLYSVCHDSCDQDGCNRALALSSVGISHMSLAIIVVTADLLVTNMFQL